MIQENVYNVNLFMSVAIALLLSNIAAMVLGCILLLPTGIILDVVGVSERVKCIFFGLPEIFICISVNVYAFVKLYKFFHHGRWLNID